jgi:hypothetical protein
MPQPADFGRFFFCAGRDMPTVSQTIALSAKNHQLVNQFSHQWMCNSMDCGFKTADF